MQRKKLTEIKTKYDICHVLIGWNYLNGDYENIRIIWVFMV